MTLDNDREALSWSMLTVGKAPQAAHHNDPDDVWTVMRSAQLIILGITKIPRPKPKPALLSYALFYENIFFAAVKPFFVLIC